jgi:hypothetical protein
MSSSVTARASEFSSSASAGALGFEANNLGVIDEGAVGGGRASRSSFYESSYAATGDVSGLGAGLGGLGSSYESSAYRSSTGGFGGGIDTAFAAADTNNDGILSQAEFRNAGF